MTLGPGRLQEHGAPAARTSATTTMSTGTATRRPRPCCAPRRVVRVRDKPLLLVALAVLAQLPTGLAFVSEMQALYHHSSPIRPAAAPLPYRGIGWRRPRPPKADAPPPRPEADPLRITGDLDLANLPVRHLGLAAPSAVAAAASIERFDEDPAVDGRAEDRADQRVDDERRADAEDVDSDLVERAKKNYADDAEQDEYEDDDYGDGGLVPGVLSQGKATAPFWHWPCGRSVDLVVAPVQGRSRAKGPGHRRTKSVGRRINDALERVWRQLNMTVLHYTLQRFDKLYYQVVIGVNEDHYIPSWVPDKDDLPKLSLDDIRSSHRLAHELTRMHTQLQKFSVALEQMSEDNRRDDSQRHNALSKTKNYVKMLLCEVEWALLSLAIPLPDAVPPGIMSPSERNITDNTNRAIRDWGVLIKYRDFLHSWADIVAQAGREQRAQAEAEERASLGDGAAEPDGAVDVADVADVAEAVDGAGALRRVLRGVRVGAGRDRQEHGGRGRGAAVRDV